MADARKRARRGAQPPVPEAAAEPGRGRQPEAAEVPEAELVFSDEPTGPGQAAPPAPSASAAELTLPASGLAEDILARLGAASPATAATAAGDRVLPASGLAEEVLGREQTLSFFSAPAHQQRAAAEATEHLATFLLAREEYGVDVKQVQEIRRVGEITSVPRAPEFVRGVINLRGHILPVLDLRRKLGLGEVVVDRASRIVVVRVRERLLGLLVDGASQVLKVPVSRVESPPEEVVQRGGDYIRGVAKLEDRLIILVDLERLLAHELTAAGTAATGAPVVEATHGVSQE